MSRLRFLLTFALLTVAADATVAQGQPPAKDPHGDPLPAGAVARLGTIRFRHEGTILYAAFLKDGKRVFSVGSDGTACVWEFPSGKRLHFFETHPAKERLAGTAVRLTSTSLSPDGKHLTAFSSDGFLHIFDLVNAKQLGKVANAIEPAAGPDRYVSPSGLVRASRSRYLQGQQSPVYSPDSKTLLLTGSSRVLQFVDLATAREVGPPVGHAVALTAVRFTPDGRQLLTKDDQTIRRWDAATRKLLGAMTPKLPPSAGVAPVYSADGKVGAMVVNFVDAWGPGMGGPGGFGGVMSQKVVLFDAVAGKALGEIALEQDNGPGFGPINRSRPLLLSPDGKLLAVSLGSDNNGKERIGCYEVPSGKLLHTLDVGVAANAKQPGKLPARLRFAAATQRLLFAPNGQVLAVQPATGAAVLLFDTTTGKTIVSIPPTKESARPCWASSHRTSAVSPWPGRTAR